MASKTEETLQKEEMLEKGDPETPPDDLSDAAIKKLIRSAKKRGYVSHDQINSVLPSEEVNSEQIEDVLAMFSEMGVNVVEAEEVEEGEEPREEADEEAESEGGDQRKRKRGGSGKRDPGNARYAVAAARPLRRRRQEAYPYGQKARLCHP